MNSKRQDYNSKNSLSLVTSLACFRALVAAAFAVVCLLVGLYLTIQELPDELTLRRNTWRWIYFLCAFWSSLLIIWCVVFIKSLRSIDRVQRQRGRRQFAHICTITAIGEIAVAVTAFLDLQAVTSGEDDVIHFRSSTGQVFFLVSCSSYSFLAILDIAFILTALLCERSQFYKQLAIAKDSEETTVFERRPSSKVSVENEDFSIESLDDETTILDVESQPTPEQQKDRENSTVIPSLVNNEIYGRTPPISKRLRPVPPPLPPVETIPDETPVPPLPTSPIPNDEEDVPSSPKTTKFPLYRSSSLRRSNGGSKSPHPYEGTRFAYYDKDLGTFLRPNVLPDKAEETQKQDGN